VLEVPLRGGAPRRVAACRSEPAGLFAYGRAVYWIEPRDRGSAIVGTTGDTPPRDLVTRPSVITELVADATHFYFFHGHIALYGRAQVSGGLIYFDDWNAQRVLAQPTAGGEPTTRFSLLPGKPARTSLHFTADDDLYVAVDRAIVKLSR
jgi:hypothetical protein